MKVHLLVCLMMGMVSATALAGKGGNGNGNAGGKNSATTLPQVTGLTASNFGVGQVALRWDPCPGATAYWVLRDGTDISGYVNNIIALPGNNTWFNDYKAIPGATHTYYVMAVAGGERGPFSAPVTIITWK